MITTHQKSKTGKHHQEGLALVGFGIATYLALYQLEVFATVWEPLFGNGSVEILNSSVSHILPIPDAALGAFGYLLGCSHRRYRRCKVLAFHTLDDGHCFWSGGKPIGLCQRTAGRITTGDI